MHNNWFSSASDPLDSGSACFSLSVANPIRWISIMEYCEDGYERTMDTKGLFGL
jgi:hypothetical protein